MKKRKKQKEGMILMGGTHVTFGETRVKVIQLGDTIGFLVSERNMSVRRLGATGVVIGYVPGHGGDVIWVRHDDDGTVGAYAFYDGRWKKDSELKIIYKKRKQSKS